MFLKTHLREDKESISTTTPFANVSSTPNGVDQAVFSGMDDNNKVFSKSIFDFDQVSFALMDNAMASFAAITPMHTRQQAVTSTTIATDDNLYRQQVMDITSSFAKEFSTTGSPLLNGSDDTGGGDGGDDEEKDIYHHHHMGHFQYDEVEVEVDAVNQETPIKERHHDDDDDNKDVDDDRDVVSLTQLYRHRTATAETKTTSGRAALKTRRTTSTSTSTSIALASKQPIGKAVSSTFVPKTLDFGQSISISVDQTYFTNNNIDDSDTHNSYSHHHHHQLYSNNNSAQQLHSMVTKEYDRIADQRASDGNNNKGKGGGLPAGRRLFTPERTTPQRTEHSPSKSTLTLAAKTPQKHVFLMDSGKSNLIISPARTKRDSEFSVHLQRNQIRDGDIDSNGIRDVDGGSLYPDDSHMYNTDNDNYNITTDSRRSILLTPTESMEGKLNNDDYDDDRTTTTTSSTVGCVRVPVKGNDVKDIDKDKAAHAWSVTGGRASAGASIKGGGGGSPPSCRAPFRNGLPTTSNIPLPIGRRYVDGAGIGKTVTTPMTTPRDRSKSAPVSLPSRNESSETTKNQSEQQRQHHASRPVLRTPSRSPMSTARTRTVASDRLDVTNNHHHSEKNTMSMVKEKDGTGGQQQPLMLYTPLHAKDTAVISHTDDASSMTSASSRTTGYVPSTDTETYTEGVDEWKEAIAPTSGKTYFYNRRTRQSTWRLPPDAFVVKLAGGEHTDDDGYRIFSPRKPTVAHGLTTASPISIPSRSHSHIPITHTNMTMTRTPVTSGNEETRTRDNKVDPKSAFTVIEELVAVTHDGDGDDVAARAEAVRAEELKNAREATRLLKARSLNSLRSRATGLAITPRKTAAAAEMGTMSTTTTIPVATESSPTSTMFCPLCGNKSSLSGFTSHLKKCCALLNSSGNTATTASPAAVSASAIVMQVSEILRCAVEPLKQRPKPSEGVHTEEDDISTRPEENSGDENNNNNNNNNRGDEKNNNNDNRGDDNDDNDNCGNDDGGGGDSGQEEDHNHHHHHQEQHPFPLKTDKVLAGTGTVSVTGRSSESIKNSGQRYQSGTTHTTESCPHCNRKFAIGRLVTHERVCRDVFGPNRRRETFDGRRKRLQGTQMEYFRDTSSLSSVPVPVTGSPNKRVSAIIPTTKTERSFRSLSAGHAGQRGTGRGGGGGKEGIPSARSERLPYMTPRSLKGSGSGGPLSRLSTGV